MLVPLSNCFLQDLICSLFVSFGVLVEDEAGVQSAGGPPLGGSGLGGGGGGVCNGEQGAGLLSVGGRPPVCGGLGGGGGDGMCRVKHRAGVRLAGGPPPGCGGGGGGGGGMCLQEHVAAVKSAGGPPPGCGGLVGGGCRVCLRENGAGVKAPFKTRHPQPYPCPPVCQGLALTPLARVGFVLVMHPEALQGMDPRKLGALQFVPFCPLEPADLPATYTTILETRFSSIASSAIRALPPVLVNAMLAVYHEERRRLQPGPGAPHYALSTSALVNVCEGLMMVDPQEEPTGYV